MTNMFSGAKVFRGTGVDLWNTAKTKNMYAMFNGAFAFNADLGNANEVAGVWKTGLVVEMGVMFANTKAFAGIGLGKFDISAICLTCGVGGQNGFVTVFLNAEGLTSCSKRKMLEGWKDLDVFKTTADFTTWTNENVECTTCAVGQKRNALTTGCSPCAAGKYALKDNIAYDCTACDAGKYTDNTVLVKGACEECIAGKAQPAKGQSSCDLCDGKGVSQSGGAMGFQAETGKATCDTCAAYTKPTSTHDECVCVNPCPAVRVWVSGCVVCV
jgi:hypothetical protein